MALIALDIDGTITSDKYHISERILDYLYGLVQKGHTLLFSTGRTFSFSYPSLQSMRGDFFFAAQNGSVLFKMPDQEIIDRFYMDPTLIPLIEEAHFGIEEDFLIYAGAERGDFCFYRKERFSPKMVLYLEDLMTRERALWRSVADFNPQEIGQFPMVKCIGSYSSMLKIQERLQKQNSFSLSINKDPFQSGYFLLQITSQYASKGKVMERLFAEFGKNQSLIAAGDDINDLSMLKLADKKIVIETAPDSLKAIADYLAAPPDRFGIIEALERALADL